MPDEVYLDSAFAIALAVETDEHHARAMTLSFEIEAARTRLVTTHAVLLEVGNSLSKQRYRNSAVELIEALNADPTVTILPVTEDLYAHAFRLFSERPDKEWSLTDCMSFVVMEERKIETALTSDAHFEQAGFVALLRKS